MRSVSLVTERFERIDVHCAAHRNPARQQRHDREHDSDCGQRGQVAGLDAEQECAEDARQNQRRSDAQDDAARDQTESLAENEIPDVILPSVRAAGISTSCSGFL